MARHLIQAFAPGKTTSQQAHQIGKYLAFRHKDKKETGRFTRTKANVLGENYTKERIKERIEDPNKHRRYNQEYHYEKCSYKKPDTIVDMKNNEKVK